MRIPWVGILTWLGATSLAVAQHSPRLARITDLNRAGQWEEAAQAAKRFLDDGGSDAAPTLERCEAYGGLIYAQARLGRVEEARASLGTYDGQCKEIAREHWVSNEVARLRLELAAQKTAPAVPVDGFWRQGDPAALGMSLPALEKHRLLCEKTGADACLVVRRGVIVQEFYFATYRAPMYAMSSTKSITGLLTGLLLDDGKVKSVDVPVCTYIPEWCDAGRKQVTVRHLLTMTSGLPRMYDEGVASTNDKNPFVIALKPSAEPGATWTYSNEGVQLLSPILDKAAGEPIQEYAQRRLFGPLGMKETRLHLDAKGHAWTYADMETTPRDLARIGLLMLHKGVWRGRRVLSSSWVELSTRASQKLNAGYGYLWWLYAKPRGYAALGYLDTNLYVFPDKDLVVVRMQSKPAKGQPRYEAEALELFDAMVPSEE